MSRRSFFVAIGTVLFLGITVGATLYGLVHYVPGHYRRASVPSGERRAALSAEFYKQFCKVYNDRNYERDWDGTFMEEQINGYLDEQFVRGGLGNKLPDGITEPRVVFDQDRIHLAFRYRSKLINTVVSISARVWLPKAERNAVAIQLEGFRAGALPFTAQWLLERIAETARQNGIEVNWYRNEGHPVALLRFQADQARQTYQLTAIQIEKGRITILGRTADDRAAIDANAGKSSP